MSKEWDLSISGGGDSVGGWWPVRNLAQGYHGIEKQWWEYYAKKNPRVLLISESNDVKDDFQKEYPDWMIATTDMPGGQDCDLALDLCEDWNIDMKFDLIICQATLEHLYNPFKALENMSNVLAEDGIIVIHTQAPKFPYHPWPVDCFRFMNDWWKEVEKHFPLELIEFYNHNDYHVFACYRRIK